MSRPRLPDEAKRPVLSIPGVTTVGESMRDGEWVVVVGVEPGADPRLPAEVGGYPVVVVERGPSRFLSVGIQSMAPDTSRHRERHRPIHPGLSTSNEVHGGTGTTGPVMADGDGRWFVTSNAHVYAWPDGERGDPISQMGIADSGSFTREELRFGYLEGFTQQFWGMRTDIAFASRTLDSGSCTRLDPQIFGLDYAAPTGSAEPAVGDEIDAVGRTTGVTSGTVTEVGQLAYVGEFGGDLYEMRNQAYSDDLYAEPGDSGTPIVRRSTGEVLGMLVGQNTTSGVHFFEMPTAEEITQTRVVTHGEVDTACESTPPPECTGDGDCPTGEVCVDGSCLLEEPNGGSGGGGDDGSSNAAVVVGAVAIAIALASGSGSGSGA